MKSFPFDKFDQSVKAFTMTINVSLERVDELRGPEGSSRSRTINLSQESLRRFRGDTTRSRRTVELVT